MNVCAQMQGRLGISSITSAAAGSTFIRPEQNSKQMSLAFFTLLGRFHSHSSLLAACWLAEKKISRIENDALSSIQT